MNGAGRTIAKNASILMASQLVTWGLALLLVVFQPRYLGPEGIGALNVAGSIWAILGVLIVFGTNTLLVKEIARTPERAADLCATALVLRILLYGLSWVFVALYLELSNTPPDVVALVIILGISQVISIGAGVGQAAIQGLEVMAYGSIAEIVAKAVNLVLVIIVLMLGYGVVAVALAGAIASFVSFVVQQRLLRRRMRIRLYFDLSAAMALAWAGLPYLVSALVMTLYRRVDALLISALVDQRSVGYYSAVQQLVGTLLFIPTVLITASFPKLSRMHTHDPTMLHKLVRKSFDVMLVVAVPIGLGTIVISDQLVVLLFGSEFASSGPILAAQGVTLIFLFLTILLGRFLVSTDRQNTWTIVMLVATVVTVPLDLVLIPWCQQTFGNGALGGALSFVITELSMVIIGIVLLPKGTLTMTNVCTASRIFYAGLVMLAVAWQFRDMFIAVPVIVGAATYTGLILLMRVIPSEDFALIKDMVRQGATQLRRPAKNAPATVPGVLDETAAIKKA